MTFEQSIKKIPIRREYQKICFPGTHWEYNTKLGRGRNTFTKEVFRGEYAEFLIEKKLWSEFMLLD